MFDRRALYVAILMVGLLVLATGCSVPTTAATAATAPNRTITVVGLGKAYGTPDVANITIGVETRDPSVQVAVDNNATKMQAVLAAIKALGIADKDVQTSNYSIYTERNVSPLGLESQGSEGQLVYVVTNQVSVKVRDLSKLGDVLDGVVQAGANSIYGIQFSVDDPTELEAQARADAVADAKARAESLAKLSDVAVGEVLTISEVVSGAGPLYAYERAAAAPSAPIEPGQLEYQMSVQVTYAIQ